MLNKQSIRDVSLDFFSGKRVLVRVDFNVPFHNGLITNDARIKASIPTIQFLLDAGAIVILASHLGRPQGMVDPSLSLKPVASRIQALLQCPVLHCEDCVGDSVMNVINHTEGTRVFLLENLRFYTQELDNDDAFSRELASLADIFVQDAFGVVHRSHASTEGISNYLPVYAGLLIEKEMMFLGKVMETPRRPLVAIVGGSKISTKISVLQHLLQVVDTLIIGGGMAFTFLKAMGYSVGLSLCEEKKIEVANDLLEYAKTFDKHVVLPIDVVVADACSAESDISIVNVDKIPSNKMGLDIGPESLMMIKHVLDTARTVIWNGPLGVFEIDQFSNGTCTVAKLLANTSAITIVGGGDSVAAVQKTGLGGKMDHISMGGGACLEYIEGKMLPGINVIKDKV